MSRIAAFRLSLVGIIALSMTHAPITITPAAYDFGKSPVGSDALPEKIFRITVSPNLVPRSRLSLQLIGLDKDDFVLATANEYNLEDRPSRCTISTQGAVCQAEVEFRPRSVGPKRARLEVFDRAGNWVEAEVKGEGIAATCLSRVVPCNFAHLWTGVFGWRSVSNSSGSQETETVDVIVTRGVAFCNGGATSSAEGRTHTGRIQGPGLFAVEFLKDPGIPWVYRITAACPSPHWPKVVDPNPARPEEAVIAEETPSRPAELGHNEQSSDKQIASKTAMTLEQLISRLSTLEGRIMHPGSDALTGVTGSITVSWKLSWYPSAEKK